MVQQLMQFITRRVSLRELRKAAFAGRNLRMSSAVRELEARVQEAQEARGVLGALVALGVREVLDLGALDPVDPMGLAKFPTTVVRQTKPNCSQERQLVQGGASDHSQGFEDENLGSSPGLFEQ